MIIVASASGKCHGCLIRLHRVFADLELAREHVASLQTQADTYFALLPDNLQQEAVRSTFHCIPVEESD